MSQRKKGVRCTLRLHDFDEKKVRKENRMSISVLGSCTRCGELFDKFKLENVCECGDLADLHQEITCDHCKEKNTVCYGCRECDHFTHRYHLRYGGERA